MGGPPEAPSALFESWPAPGSTRQAGRRHGCSRCVTTCLQRSQTPVRLLLPFRHHLTLVVPSPIRPHVRASAVGGAVDREVGDDDDGGGEEGPCMAGVCIYIYIYIRTVAAGVLDHVVDGGVEVGVHDAGGLVLGLEAGDLRLELVVVVGGQVVELLEAPEAVVVAAVGGAVDGEVDGEAADGEHPGHHDVRGAHRDQLLDPVGDGAHDLRRVRARLVRVVVAEQHRVVVVAPELAEHEQGVAQVALAVCD